jgi:hypothetical protein
MSAVFLVLLADTTFLRILILGTSVNKFVAKVASIHRDFIADSYIFDVCCGKAGKGAAMNENPHD